MEDQVIPTSGRTPADRAKRFGQAAIEGEGGLTEMQQALSLAQQGLMTFDEVEERLVNLTALAAEGKGVLVGRRAFHCLLQVQDERAPLAHPPAV